MRSRIGGIVAVAPDDEGAEDVEPLAPDACAQEVAGVAITPTTRLTRESTRRRGSPDPTIDESYVESGAGFTQM